MKVEEKTYYIDVTNEWLKNKIQKSEVIDQLYYEHESKKYIVDGKNVVLDYSKKEKEVAKWLSNTFGGVVYMLPRVNFPKKISTADYIFKNEKWDLKEINGSSKRVIENSLKDKKRQAQNFILDFSKSDLHREIIFKQLNELFKNVDRQWINCIIIKKDNDLICVCQRKIKRSRPRPITCQD